MYGFVGGGREERGVGEEGEERGEEGEERGEEGEGRRGGISRLPFNCTFSTWLNTHTGQTTGQANWTKNMPFSWKSLFLNIVRQSPMHAPAYYAIY